MSCPRGKNKILILFVSITFLLFSVCFGALAYVNHKKDKKLFIKNKKNKARPSVRVMIQQTEIKDHLIRIDEKIRRRGRGSRK